MFEPPQPNSTPAARPNPIRAGVAPMPVQRGNYGIPARQSMVPPQPLAPATPVVPPTPAVPATSIEPVAAGVPRMADVSAPRPKPTFTPIAPMNIAAPTEQPVVGIPTPPPQVAVPTAAAVAAPVAQAPFTPTVPLFTPSQPITASAKPKQAAKLGVLLPKIILVTAVVGLLLALGGIGRLVTAGSTAGDTIAVGAVTANDGSTIHIQFTADDGMLHKYKTTGKQSKLIPGSAVEMAYQPGAPDKTAKLVSVVKTRHNLGVSLMTTGILLLIIAGTLKIVRKLRQPKKPVVEQATAVAV